MGGRNGEDTFQTGVESMDAEHKTQHGMVDALCDALRQGRDPSEIDEILDQVIDYTRVHFMAEELLMRLNEYPNSKPHLNAHAEIIRDLRAVREGVKTGAVPDALIAVEAIRERLRRHVAGHDHALGNYLGERDG